MWQPTLSHRPLNTIMYFKGYKIYIYPHLVSNYDMENKRWVYSLSFSKIRFCDPDPYVVRSDDMLRLGVSN